MDPSHVRRLDTLASARGSARHFCLGCKDLRSSFGCRVSLPSLCAQKIQAKCGYDAAVLLASRMDVTEKLRIIPLDDGSLHDEQDSREAMTRVSASDSLLISM